MSCLVLRVELKHMQPLSRRFEFPLNTTQDPRQRSLGRSLASGFTVIEVLVAILVSSTFVGLTLQALVTSAAFRAKAAQFDEASLWVQEDLEQVVYQASQYEITAFPYSNRCSATIPSEGLAAGFIADSTVGLGGSAATLGPRTLGGKSFQLTRNANFAASPDPFRLLQLTYAVSPADGGPAIATISTEVLPQAVLKCP